MEERQKCWPVSLQNAAWNLYNVRAWLIWLLDPDCGWLVFTLDLQVILWLNWMLPLVTPCCALWSCFCFIFLLLSSCFQSFIPGKLGWRDSGRQGGVHWIWQPLSNSDGLFPPYRGVDGYASRTFTASSSFYSRFFAVWTAHSASPLDWAWRGLLETSLNSQSLANLANSTESYWGQLYHFWYTMSGKHGFEGMYPFRWREGWQIIDLNEL